MKAPVVFKQDGIRTLILDNANRNIPADFGYLDITEKTFPVHSSFWPGSWNVALYHESVWELGRWDVYFRGENLLGRQYPVFYFKSIGHEFFALSRPRQLTLGLTFKIK